MIENAIELQTGSLFLGIILAVAEFSRSSVANPDHLASPTTLDLVAQFLERDLASLRSKNGSKRNRAGADRNRGCEPWKMFRPSHFPSCQSVCLDRIR